MMDWRLSKTLKVLNTWKTRSADIDFLNKERGNKYSSLVNVLGSGRNEVMFHFERKTIADTIAKSETVEDVLVAYGKTPENHDLVYGIVDHLILRHLVIREGSGRPVEAIYQEYIDYVGSFSGRIVRRDKRLHCRDNRGSLNQYQVAAACKLS